MKKTILLVCLLSLCFTRVKAQDATIQRKSLNITKIEEPVQIDGLLEEAIWQSLPRVSGFTLNQPVDNQTASQKTEVQIAYDEKSIYIAATLWDDEDYIVQTLKRDNTDENDEFLVLIDPVGQQANGFLFSTSAFGVQSEALVSSSASAFSSTDFDLGWDNRWFSGVKRFKDRWTVEVAIPFKTLRYKANIKEWGINFFRMEPGKNEIHVWSPVPRQFEFIDLGYTARLFWQEAPDKQGSNISLIPYVTSRMEQVSGEDGSETEFKLDAGMDAKVAITPTLNLDLTVNPDFSQVEVDRQVTNLTRFNIFFPERRQFFLENADIFNGFGQFAERPFYSRRIGLDPFGQTVPIQYGLRLSGNLNDRLRIGILNMHTGGNADRLAQNYSALTFQQRIWKRSSIKGVFLNRQSFNDGELMESDYGRNLGGEFNFISTDGKWTAQAGYLHSMKEGFNDKNQHAYASFNYSGVNFRTFTILQNMGQNYFADMGFTGRLFNFDPISGQVFRIGFTQFANMLDYYIYPKNSEKVNFHWSGLENFIYFNENTGLNEWYTRLRHFIFFKNTSQLRFRLNNNYIDLVYPFAITETPLPVDEYNMTEFNIQFNTDVRKLLNTQWFIVYGQFYNGEKLTYRGSVNYRIQPWGTFTLGIEQNHIWLPAPYGNVDLTLATGRFDLNFTTNLFWTTFLQYNTQADNFNINSRLQWRFAPMSDLFLVYTDNYAVEGMFGPKNRSLVLKMNYWLTL